MKITIDTQEDAPEDIRKVIAMLSALVSQHQASAPPLQMFSENTSTGGSVFDLFKDDQSQQSQQNQAPPEEKKEEGEEQPGLIFEY